MTHPISSVIIDGTPIDKSAFRAYIRSQLAFILASASEITGLTLEDTLGVILNGNLYRYDAADTATAHNGVTTLVDATTPNGRRYKRALPELWVDEFGARADGSFNNAPAIASAVATANSIGGAIIRFGPGEYAVAAHPGIVLPNSGVYLKGFPSQYVFGGGVSKGTRIKYTGPAGGIVCYVAPTAGTMSAVRIEDLTLDCNALANIGLYIGTVHDYYMENLDIEARHNASSIGLYMTDNIAAGSVYHLRGTLSKIVVSAPGSATGILLDSPLPDTGGRHGAFITFLEPHVTNENGDAFFLRNCDNVHVFNGAVSRIEGGTGRAIHFYGSNTTDLQAALGCSFYGFNSNADILVTPGTTYPPLGNRVFLTSVDHQIVVTDTGGYLQVYDSGLGASTPGYQIVPKTTIRHAETSANSIVEVLRLARRTSGTPAMGLGARLGFELETSAANFELAAAIDAVLTDPTAANEDSDLVFNVMLNGTLVEAARLTSKGKFTLSLPGAGGLGGLGYGVGAGGSVTQATSKSTGVTLNTLCGQITMHHAALAARAEVSFTVTNSAVLATDIPSVVIASGATVDTYMIAVTAVENGSFRIGLINVSRTRRSEALVLNFKIDRSATT